MLKTEQLIACFANEDKELRHTIDFVIDIFDKYLVLKPAPSKRHFYEISKEIYTEATTESELTALQKALWWSFESAVQEQPHLRPPIQKMRVLPPRPFFNESTPRLGDIAAVLAYYQTFLAHSDTSVRLLATTLMLAKHVGITRLEQLFCKAQIFILQSAHRALICHHDGYLILDAVGLMLWRRLNQSKTSAEQLRLDYFSLYTPKFGHLRTLDEAIYAVGLLEQPSFGSALASISCPLTAEDVADHLTDQRLATNSARAPQTYKKLKRRITFVLRDQVNTAASLAFGQQANTCALMSELSLCLRRFKQQSQKEHRNCLAFKQCKASLHQLLLKSKNGSTITAVLVHYCVSLFLHGSAWKKRLAVNTVLTYQSTLRQFCSIVLSDEVLLRQAQSQTDALAELTDLIESYLVTQPFDKQNTVLIFLQYIHEHVPLRLADESLDILTEKQLMTRAHYMSPKLFDRALAKVSDASTRWFLCVCYYLGLRHEEAQTLAVDDVSAEFIYVTKRSKRKSMTSVRRVSLMFMPSDMRIAFLEFVALRKHHSTQLFTKRVIDFYLPTALTDLRNEAGNAQFVVHSLRHCAANNILFLLTMITFERQDWRKRYSLFQHHLFSDETITQIKTQFQNCGHPLRSQSAVLSILASQLGHASPVVTASSYLHFLPFLNFELHAQRGKAPHRDFLGALLPDNSYRYVLLKSQFFDEAAWFKHAARSLSKTVVQNRVDLQDIAKPSSLLDYVSALHVFLTTNQPSIVFTRSEDVPLVNACTLAVMLNHTKTLRQLEFISKQRWTAKAVRAVKTLQDCLENKQKIRNIRTLRHVLFALNCLHVNALEARVSGPEIHTWCEVAKRFDCTLRFDEQKTRGPSLAICDIKSGRKHIQYLHELTKIICFYINYRGVLNG